MCQPWGRISRPGLTSPATRRATPAGAAAHLSHLSEETGTDCTPRVPLNGKQMGIHQKQVFLNSFVRAALRGKEKERARWVPWVPPRAGILITEAHVSLPHCHSDICMPAHQRRPCNAPRYRDFAVPAVDPLAGPRVQPETGTGLPWREPGTTTSSNARGRTNHCTSH